MKLMTSKDRLNVYPTKYGDKVAIGPYSIGINLSNSGDGWLKIIGIDEDISDLLDEKDIPYELTYKDDGSKWVIISKSFLNFLQNAN